MFLLIHLSLLLSAAFTCAQKDNKPPDIVFILTDDQDMRMHSLDHMQKLQSLLMDEGTSYIRHYAPTALCCPARVSILTGLHAHNHLVTDVSGPNGGWHQVLAGGFNDNYLPIWLQEAGYRTYYTGKLYNGMHTDLVEKMTARGWTKADLLVGQNVYQYNGPPFQNIEGDWTNPNKVHVFHNEYTTDKVANYSYGYLRDAINQVGKNTGPPIPAKKYKGTRPDAKIPRADNFNPSHSDLNNHFQRTWLKFKQRSGVNIVWTLEKLRDNQVEKLDHHYQCRTEALLSVDDMVEEVVSILDKAGRLNNTYIIYTSDNGFHLGHHRLGAGKRYAFEEDINVPLIIRGPGVPKGRTTDIVSAHVDLAPTILHMAGIAQRPDFDGTPIPYTSTSIQQQEGTDADEHANIEFWTGATYTTHRIKRKRVNSYKSVRLVGKSYDIMYSVQCQYNSHELYDMSKDPVQMRNLHPTAPAGKGQPNPYDSGETKIAGYDIKLLLSRIDALLLVLKSCKRRACSNPWEQLHLNGEVKSLRDAMGQEFDDKYYKLPKVQFRKCFKNGTIDLWAEGPQWHAGLADATVSFDVETDQSETLQVRLETPLDLNEGENEDEDWNEDLDDDADVDWEVREYLDDWE
ncbi:putative arylsulfatase [Phaeomoniella chlamydospora]|uniref:Putative arylsulfatase n=1 Tax=Phaeomoniella chlamydospora TaxID=158046 RepID=A0A0G2GKZ0_PHACM|nr:putative arylsulfatase [Phaeomoniella chlamydospora]